MPFQQIPPGSTSRNNRSALDHPDVVNPLRVSIQPNGKKRLILDLRYINNFLIKHRVKYEDWKIALFYFQKGSFMITFDLKSGYHHEIHSHHLRFLGFA